MKKFFIALLILIAGVVAYAKRTEMKDWIVESQKPEVPAVSYQDTGSTNKTNTTYTTNTAQPTQALIEPNPKPADTTTTTQTPSATLPATFNLAVPFTSQAPKSNWDALHEETCEEASILMADYYYQGKPAGKIDPDEADAALLKIVDFENSFIGYYQSTTAEQTASLLEAMFNLTYDLVENPTVEQIKQAIADGHPVIVPAAGRQLGNPNFTGAGPLYHMFLIKGYTADGFITNDPGTRLGADYFYPYDVVMNAMHDWNDGDVDNGQKIVIVVKP